MLVEHFEVSQRRACSVLGVSRSAFRYEALPRDDEGPLRAEVIRLATRYGRYGYRMIAALMRNAGWIQATEDRVQRIWSEEGLKVPEKQPKRGRLWLAEGSCIRLRPHRPNHVWSYDFVTVIDAGGRKMRMLTLIDEFTRECLAIHCARSIGADQVIEVLAEVMLVRGTPEHLRSDNGPEFIATRLRHWLATLAVKPLYIEPGSPWENGYCESFNGTLRDELLKRRALLRREGVAGDHRAMGEALQHRAAAFEPGLPAARAAGLAWGASLRPDSVRLCFRGHCPLKQMVLSQHLDLKRQQLMKTLGMQTLHYGLHPLRLISDAWSAIR